MKSKVLYLLLLIIPLTAHPVPAQETMRFGHLSIEDGLSQATVETILQDRLGFIWIGTEDGLNRYDGHSFTVFRHDPDDTNSITSGNIWCLHEDRDGYLWVGTFADGLNRFDPITGAFTHYTHDPADPRSISSNRIRSITEDVDGCLWIGTRSGGLNRLEAGTRRFSKWRHDPDSKNSLPSDDIRYVHIDSAGVLWIATRRGLCCHDPNTGEYIHYRADAGGAATIPHDNVRYVYPDRYGMLWISTGGGLSRHDPTTGTFANYLHDPHDPTSIGSNSIRKIYEDRQGRLWVGANRGGLNLYDRRNDTFRTFLPNPSDPFSLGHESVRVIFQDASGVLWLGTFGGGLNTWDPRTARYRHHRHDPDDTNSLSRPIVWSIAEGPDGDLWFGGDSAILDRYDRSTGRYGHGLDGAASNPALEPTAYTREVFWDDAGRLWSGGTVGLDVYDPADGSLVRFTHDEEDPGSICSNVIRVVYQDDNGDIWIGTSRGLERYDSRTRDFTHFSHRPDDSGSLSYNIVTSLIQDRSGTYWVATTAGLNRFVVDPDGQGRGDAADSSVEFTRYYHDPDDPRSLSDSYIVSVHEAAGGDLWFGTMLGLNRLRLEDRDEPVFTRYFMKDGLPNDVIYGILEDDRGRLWLSTNFGLSCFDPVTETFRNYDTRDGLLGNEYNTGAFTRLRDGTFVFGGVGGATEFDPDSIIDSGFAAPVVLTGFEVFGEPVMLDRVLQATDEITLSHRDNYFSFEFAALDFSSPDRNRYAYMLEGLDRDWTRAGTRNFAGYTHVDAGEYTFLVKGTNGDGVWSENVAAIRVVITPPFWKTWWFIAVLVLLVGSGVALAIAVRVRQLLAIERLRSKIAADLHDDIGAGLTEISIMGAIITQKLPEEANRLVRPETDSIGRTARGLIAAMSDIVWLVNPRKDSLYDLVSRLSDSFKETLDALNIQFSTESLSSLKSVRLNMEHRQHLLLIFKEAINNSLKYSECSEIALKVGLKKKRLTLALIDNGKGFDTSEDSAGNGLKNMEYRAGQLGGSVTILSTVDSGTSVEYSGSIG